MTKGPCRTCGEVAECYDSQPTRCKECVKAAVRKHRSESLEKIAEYERKRFATPERKAAILEYQRRRRRRHPEKNAARAAVARAVRAGRLSKGACSACGSVVAVQAHHEDYSQPLNVTWLCFRCHREHGHGQTVVWRP